MTSIHHQALSERDSKMMIPAKEMKRGITYVVSGDTSKRSRANWFNHKPGERVFINHLGLIRNLDNHYADHSEPEYARLYVDVHIPTILANINHLERNISDQINQAIEAGADGVFVRKNGSWSFSK